MFSALIGCKSYGTVHMRITAAGESSPINRRSGPWTSPHFNWRWPRHERNTPTRSTSWCSGSGRFSRHSRQLDIFQIERQYVTMDRHHYLHEEVYAFGYGVSEAARVDR